jgi:hypothetical protein
MLPRRFSFLGLALALLVPTYSAHASPPDYSNELVSKADSLKLDEDPYWRILLHYRPRWFGGYKSEIDAKDFFNAPDGRTQPRAELEATIRRFFEPVPTSSQPAQCLFIDRYQWLKSKLGFDPKRLPEQPCTEFNDWKNALSPESVSLIFSAFYMSNPSSSFGHTLLRLNHHRNGQELKLLDYGVNYAANPTTSNALFYGILGMTGGFPGVFSNIPYFVKVEEYNNIESRDLWEYELTLTPQEIDRLMYHLWTVGHVQISYYFLDKNCSFMILTLLDSARPELGLSDRFDKKVWVIPSDTVRAINQTPGLVKSIAVRPSLAYRIRTERTSLLPDEDRLFLELIHDQSAEDRSRDLASVKKLPSARAAQVLDTTLDYLHYAKKTKDPLNSEVLLARADLAEAPQQIELTPEEVSTERPDAGNDSARVGLGTGYDSVDRGYASASIRPAFHDLNADPLGYPRGAQIEALSLDAHYSPDFSRFRIEKADLIDIVALTPWDSVFKKFSWTARLGADRVLDFNCSRCLEYKGEVGGGFSYAPVKPAMLYFLAKGEAGFGPDYTPGYRLGPAAEAGMLMSFTQSVSLQASGSYHHAVMGYTVPYSQEGIEARFSTSKDTDFRLGFDHYPITNEEKVTFNVYF